MKTKGHLPFAATVLCFVLVCCIELASGKLSDRNKRETQDSELHQDERMPVDTFLEGQAATGGNPVERGVLNPKKLLSLTARLALLENARLEGNGIKKKRPIVKTKPRPKRNPNYNAPMMDMAEGLNQEPGGEDPDFLFGENDFDLVDSVLFADWSKCNVSCGIGYQTLAKPCDDDTSDCELEEKRHEWRRCLGIDCKSPEYLEAKLYCKGGTGGSSSSIVIGIIVGILITLVTGGAVIFIKRFTSGKGSKTSSSKTKKKGSSRPPMPAPRDGEAKDEHIYDEVDGQSNKKAKSSNGYVSMRKKEKSKKKKKEKGKSKKKLESEDSDDTYVDPDELNQPEEVSMSEDLEIQRLRDPPPPPGRKSKKSSKRKKENEYEVPMENDYMEIE